MDASRTIQALSDCGAITAALKAEHYAIEDALQTLDGAILAGADKENLAQIMDIVLDFCAQHFSGEEKQFSGQGYFGADAHARAHEKLLSKFQEARTAILSGKIEGTLDAADLLNAFHTHVARFDRPAHAFVLQQQIVRGEGDSRHHQIELDQLYRVQRSGR